MVKPLRTKKGKSEGSSVEVHRFRPCVTADAQAERQVVSPMASSPMSPAESRFDQTELFETAGAVKGIRLLSVGYIVLYYIFLAGEV